MNREELESQLMWNGGGGGFGLCSVASSFAWALDTPGPDHPDLTSIVAIGEPKEKYTDDELKKLIEFAKFKTKDYDKMFRYRRGANLVIIDKWDRTISDKKPEYVWLRKRMSWEFGAMFSPTLDEALNFMRER